MGPPMKKHDLCALVGVTAPEGPDFSFTHVTEDSRRVRAGSLFVAVRGEKQDGHAYAAQAAAQGAAAILGDNPDLRELAGLPYLFVKQPRWAAGIAAHALLGNPSHSMTVIGITGTNGKGCSAYLMKAILDVAGFPTANFGTLGYHIGQETFHADHTTPFGEDLADMFSRARTAGMTHVVMEASSHALEQERVAGIRFGVGAFTNLTQDHLDHHGTMDAYCQAKLKLFERLEGASAFGVVNIDDPAAERFRQAASVPCYTYGEKGECRASDVRMTPQGTQFRLRTPWGEGEASLHLIGGHNVYNALCAVAVCGRLGIGFDGIIGGLATLKAVPGRFETIETDQPFLVIVDYAHTEDGLRNVLRAARKLCAGRLITVFGCGGDRDKTKRPKMGAAAAEISDFVVLTSDNPRTEDPLRILLDAEVGLQRSGKHKGDDYVVLPDRAEAIYRAIAMARRGDVVMIAGKGHEDYQILGTTKIHFDDREVARKALEALC